MACAPKNDTHLLKDQVNGLVVSEVLVVDEPLDDLVLLRLSQPGLLAPGGCAARQALEQGSLANPVLVARLLHTQALADVAHRVLVPVNQISLGCAGTGRDGTLLGLGDVCWLLGSCVFVDKVVVVELGDLVYLFHC